MQRVIRGFGVPYRLRLRRLADYGMFDPDTHTIFLDSQRTLPVQQQTLGHELTHLIEDHYGLNLTEHEVDKIGVGWVILLQNNPALIKFLTRKR